MIDKKLIQLLEKRRRYIPLTVLSQWLGLLAGVWITLRIATFLATLMSGGQADFPFVQVVVAILLRLLSHYLAGRCRLYITSAMEGEVRKRALNKIYALPGYTLGEFGPSELIQLIGEGVDQMVLYNSMYLPQLIYSMVAALTLFLVLRPISSWIALVLFICVPLIPVSIMVMSRFAKKTMSNYWVSYVSLGKGFLENLLGLTTLKLYGADGERHRRMNEQAEAFRVATMEVLSMQLNSITVMDLIAYGGAATGMILALIGLSLGKLDFRGALIVILLSAEFFVPMRLLGSFFHISMNGLIAGQKLMKLLDIPVPEGTLHPNHATPVKLKELSFSYDGVRQVLDGVNMKIEPGEMVGIVGMSGSGKSTLAKFFHRELNPPRGTCFIDGCDMAQVSMGKLYEHIVYLGHEDYILAGTVRENMTMGHEVKDEKLLACLEQVKLKSLFEEAEGLDTVLRENGSNLSGGQRQRLALARGLLHPGALLVLDEATSNIDEESENIIMEHILSMRGTRSVLIISHRMANTASCDRIYVMDQGRIREEGSPQDLLAQEGIYASLYHEQMKYEQFGKEVGTHENPVFQLAVD